MNWTSVAPAVTTAFVSSLVEAVEALTIVLAVASVRGWRPAATGALAGLALLVVIVLALGPLTQHRGRLGAKSGHVMLGRCGKGLKSLTNALAPT